MIGNTLRTFDDWSLAGTRLVGFVVCCYTLTVLYGILKNHFKGRDTVIPTPVVVFTTFWVSVLAIIQAELLVADSEPINSGWLRALYGMSFIWSICGLAWIIRIGTRHTEAMQIRADAAEWAVRERVEALKAEHE